MRGGRRFELEDEAATARLGQALARRSAPGDVIALEGPLGAGKTALARAFIAERLGGPVEAPSPTFNLVLTYPAETGTVWHFDLYRIADAAELDELGIEEAFADGVSLVEWPDRLGDRLPADSLTVRLRPTGETTRSAELAGGGTWPERLAHV